MSKAAKALWRFRAAALIWPWTGPGDAFTNETRLAWVDAYRRLSSTMLEAQLNVEAADERAAA